jgi:hypothetical protein
MSVGPSPGPVAIIVASVDALATVAESLGGFLREVGTLGEVLLVDASRDGTAEEVARMFPAVRVLRRPRGALVPELWRDGLLAAPGAQFVAFSTAQMVPRPGWLSALFEGLGGEAVATGGPIAPGGSLGAFDFAVALHRYGSYWPPLAGPHHPEPPGDNALYRRDSLENLSSVWERGFWEVEVHRALRARGQAIGWSDRAVVEYRGGDRIRPTLARRFSHARRYGSGRALGRSVGYRLARTILAPAIPALLGVRAIRTLRRHPEARPKMVAALAALVPILTAWAMGETIGLWRGAAPDRDRSSEGILDLCAPSHPTSRRPSIRRARYCVPPGVSREEARNSVPYSFHEAHTTE